MKRTHNHVFVLLISLAWGLKQPTYAHSPALWAEVMAGGQVYIEAYLSDGTRARGARVLVQNAHGQVLLEGKTDTNGKFSFKPHRIQDLTIHLELDHAHTATVTIGKDDLRVPTAGGPP